MHSPSTEEATFHESGQTTSSSPTTNPCGQTGREEAEVEEFLPVRVAVSILGWVFLLSVGAVSFPIAMSIVKDEELEATPEEDNEVGNSIFYSDLLLSMEDDVFFSIVDLARKPQYPMGFTLTAFKSLKEKYESTTQASRFELKLEYESLKMKAN